MKRMWIFAISVLLGFALIRKMTFDFNTHRHSWDISNLELETTSQVLESISFEDAVHLEMQLSESGDSRIAEENLRNLENDLFEETGKPIKFYQFIGTFSVKGSDEVQGTLTTLIVAVDDSVPYIIAVRDPLTAVLCEYEDVTWTHMSSYNAISSDKRSVRVAAVGYIAWSTGDRKNPEQLSNTLYPTYNVQLR